MAACEKCWADSAWERDFGSSSLEPGERSAYGRMLDSRKDRPCYMDCPNVPPDADHYAYTGCPSCGFTYGSGSEDDES